MLTAVTLDFWDTIYLASSTPARVQRRHEVMQSMLRALGRNLPADEFKALYHASYEEAERWWREHRGYTTADRIRWLLGQLAIERPEDCEHVTRAVEEIDDTLTAFPPPLLPGAAEGIRELASRFRLGIVSDTGFPSGRAQNRLLEQDGLLGRDRPLQAAARAVPRRAREAECQAGRIRARRRHRAHRRRRFVRRRDACDPARRGSKRRIE